MWNVSTRFSLCARSAILLFIIKRIHWMPSSLWRLTGTCRMLRSQLSSLSFESWGFCYWARRLRATVTYPAVLLPSLAFCELFHSKSIACSLMNLERSSVTIFWVILAKYKILFKLKESWIKASPTQYQIMVSWCHLWVLKGA